MDRRILESGGRLLAGLARVHQLLCHEAGGPDREDEHKGSKLDWVICGGESGPGARLFNLAWARDLRDHCARDGIAFFMKQMGSKPVGNSFPFEHSKGGDMEEWPQDLRVRQMPVAA